MKTITLKYQTRCADCGASLPAGSKGKWYGRGRVYGIGCHTDAPDYSFRDPGGKSALRAGPRRFPCPTCGREGMLSQADVNKGYQCDRCADIAEGSLAYEY